MVFKLPELDEDEIERLNSLSSLVGVRRIIVEYAYRRGYRSIEEVRRFLFPSIEDLSPIKSEEVERGVMFVDSIKKGEGVLIWGHHDMDGVGAVYIISQLMEMLDVPYEVHIPHRKERYGISVDVVKEFGYRNVIVVDSGTSSYREVEELKREGYRFLIIDHHEPPDTLPDSILINPKALDVMNFREMCGAGLTLRFYMEFLKMREGYFSPDEHKDLFVIATMSTFGDRVPLVRDNRVIARYGTRYYRSVERPYFVKLARDITGEVMVYREFMDRVNTLVYSLSPEESVKLLLSKNMDEVKSLFNRAAESSDRWKRLRDELYSRVKEGIEGKNILFVIDESIDERFIGSIASNIKKEFNRPAIAVGKKSSGIWAGEARSTGSFNILQFISRFSDLFIDYGGHKQACGFSLLEDKVSSFKKRLKEEEMTLNLQTDEESVTIDGVLKVSEVDRDLLLLAPFGERNPYPLFYCPEKRIIYSIDEKLNIDVKEEGWSP